MQRFTDPGHTIPSRGGIALAAMQMAHWSEESEQAAAALNPCDGYHDIDGAYQTAEMEAEQAAEMMREAAA